MSGPIFGNSSSLGGSSGGNRHLVEFRAGRMSMVDKMVHPDPRKGLLYIYQSEDGLIHFCWKERNSSRAEDDLIVFPDDCEFKRVEQCKTGRVFLLKFKSTSRKLFFWMQEPKLEKDEEWCRRINDVMNNPPSVNSLSSSRGGNDGNDLQYMLNNMSQQQLMQLFGGVGQMGGLSTLLGSMNRPSDSSSSRTGNQTSRTSGASSTIPVPATNTPSTPTTATAAAAAASSVPQAPKKPATTARRTGADDDSVATASTPTGQPKVSLSELQNFLSGLKTGDHASGSGARGRNIDLSAAINPESVNTIAADSERTNALLPHLPTIDSNADSKKQLKDTIASPQFQQALSMFSSALQSGQLGPVVSQFEVNSEAVAAATTGDVEQFFKALEKGSEKSGSGTDAKKKDEKDSDKETPMEEDKN